MYTRSYNNSTSATRVSNRELRREAVKAIQSFEHMRLILLAVLAQNSGQLHVTTGTIEQVGQDLQYLNYEISTDPNDAKTKFVKLIDERKEQEEAVLKASRKGGMIIATIEVNPDSVALEETPAHVD